MGCWGLCLGVLVVVLPRLCVRRLLVVASLSGFVPPPCLVLPRLCVRLRLCVRRLLVVGVLGWGLVLAFVFGALGWVLVVGWCLVVAWLRVCGRGLWGVCVLWFLVLVWWCWCVCSCWWGSVGFVFLACARVRGLGCPACLVVSCGCRESGERTCLVGSLPAFSFVERIDGTRIRCLHLGGVVLSPSGLHSQCAPRPLVCVCFLRVVRPRSIVLFALGVERIDGV